MTETDTEKTTNEDQQLAVQAKNNNAVVVFKTPAIPHRRRKQKVLDEDTYAEEMGRIIQRDFFPDLEKMRAQNEYLEAMEKNDVVKIRQLYARYSGRTPGQRPIDRIPSPATFETPANIHNSQHDPSFTPAMTPPSVSDSSTKTDKVSKLSLDEYLSSHTSEDNQSFEEIMVEAEKKHRLKYSYLYQSEQRCQDDKDEQIALPTCDGSENAITDGNEPRPFQIDTWGYRNRNYIMYIPDGVEITPEEQLALVKNKQEIIHNNTRLDKKLFNERQSNETITELAKNKAKVLDGKIGVDGKELVQSIGPTINGFGFVRTPSPSLAVAQSPLMTWGEIEGTPFRLDGNDTPLPARGQGPAFKMAAPPRREQLAMALAEKASERHRDKKKKAMDAAKRQFAASSPSPRPNTSTIERLATMSPAARHLAVTRLSTSSSALRATYSPSPTGGHKTPRLAGRKTPYLGRKTPKITPKVGVDRTTTPKMIAASLGIKAKAAPDAHMTDDLLNISVPKRKSAKDFF